MVEPPTMLEVPTSCMVSPRDLAAEERRREREAWPHAKVDALDSHEQSVDKKRGACLGALHRRVVKLPKETDESVSDAVVYVMLPRLFLRQVVENNDLLSLSKLMVKATCMEWSMRFLPTNKSIDSRCDAAVIRSRC